MHIYVISVVFSCYSVLLSRAGVGKYRDYHAFMRQGSESTVITMLSCTGLGKHGNYSHSQHRGWETMVIIVIPALATRRDLETMVIIAISISFPSPGL